MASDDIKYTTDATANVSPVERHHPLTVDDLERRLAVLKAAGVREYHDGADGVKIAFERPQQPRQKPNDPYIQELQELAAQVRAEQEGAGG